ncbi:LysE family transporter [Jannaschia pohangensis]|uniref:Threonine/homoserine/homoserine lactone efflux protein n=1 Tax=Jannaschia pohangensis TaxID=390807 RepID=A0A1I3IKB6_9RHOB|nr:LysE family transporter [Jannaschia pohangensis]SFI48361.1 Threonine/homoserine/homoserine lactone efflux protein [Jannaschia pohangensis]
MDILTSLPLILGTALIASASPGPATLAIAATSMAHGAGAGVRLALGVLTGSMIWSTAAAAGLAALMLRHGWAVEFIRYAGAVYLFWLAFKSARAVWRGGQGAGLTVARRPYLRGLALHLTNPKAIFFFGALYAVILTPGQTPAALALVVLAIAVQSAIVFLGYALLFSRAGPMAVYARSARWINGLSSVVFAGFGVKLLTTRLG